MSVVEEEFLPKRLGLPADHAGSGNCDPVDSSGLVRDIAANFLKALPPKQLALTRHEVVPLATVRLRAVAFFSVNRSRHAESGSVSEFTQAKLTIVLFKQ